LKIKQIKEEMKKRLIKWGLVAALLLRLTNNTNSGILYSQKQVKQNVKLEQVVSKIEKKHHKKPEYFSRGFLQFKEGQFVQDKEIDKMIQDLSPDKEKAKTDPNHIIDGVNFYDNYCIMIDPNTHHIGDGVKKWMSVQEPEGAVYERKFTLENLKDMKNIKLGMEVFSSDSDNRVYINNKLIGFAPKMKKSQWGNLMEKYKQRTPFLYKELHVSKYLEEGENTVRIESKKSGLILRSHDDFLVRRIQMVYDKENENKINK